MKKKGLIVATIVMVLVLAVSLTTATYAWFSSTAQATVENLAIKTEAASGVQIAVFEGEKYYNDIITYDEAPGAATRWGGTEGFGTLLNFQDINIGTMYNAVTDTAETNTKSDAAKYVYTKLEEGDIPTAYTDVDGNDFYVNADGSIVLGSTIDSQEKFAACTGGTWCSRADVADGTFYRPTGYDASVQPYGYWVAEANTKAAGWTTYYDIPLAMQAVEATQAIICTISINAGENDGGLWPGMAAATRVRITPVVNGTAKPEYQQTFEPYGKYAYSAGTMTNSNASGDETGAFNFIVATGAIKPTDVFKLQIEIWVEGTDNECHTVLMNATDFDVDFAFDVVDDYATNANKDAQGNITIDTVVYKFITGFTQVVTESAGA